MGMGLELADLLKLVEEQGGQGAVPTTEPAVELPLLPQNTQPGMDEQSLAQLLMPVEPEPLSRKQKALTGIADALGAFAAVKSGRPFESAREKLEAEKRGEAQRKTQANMLRAGFEERRGERTERRSLAEERMTHERNIQDRNFAFETDKLERLDEQSRLGTVREVAFWSKLYNAKLPEDLKERIQQGDMAALSEAGGIVAAAKKQAEDLASSRATNKNAEIETIGTLRELESLVFGGSDPNTGQPVPGLRERLAGMTPEQARATARDTLAHLAFMRTSRMMTLEGTERFDDLMKQVQEIIEPFLMAPPSSPVGPPQPTAQQNEAAARPQGFGDLFTDTGTMKFGIGKQ